MIMTIMIDNNNNYNNNSINSFCNTVIFSRSCPSPFFQRGVGPFISWMARQDAANQHGNAATHFVLSPASGDFTSFFFLPLSKNGGDLGYQKSCFMMLCYQKCGGIIDE